MENDNFKLEPYQNDPKQNLHNLSTMIADIFFASHSEDVYDAMWEAGKLCTACLRELDYDNFHPLIAEIEKAKWAACDAKEMTLFAIVKAEQLAWEIFADLLIPFVLADDINPYGDISWKSDYQDNDDSETGGAK